MIDRTRAARAACTLAILALLSGCVEGAGELALGSGGSAGTRASGTVAVVSVEAPPLWAQADLRQRIETDLSARAAAASQAAPAAYLARGYVEVGAKESRITVTMVWDVFNRDLTRAARIERVMALDAAVEGLSGAGGEAALRLVSAQSADALAAFLAGAPPDAAPSPARVALGR